MVYAASSLAGALLFVVVLESHSEPLALILGWLGRLEAVAFLCSAALFCIWVYRASSNASVFSPTPLRISPAWSVAWFFIPIAHLWQPFRSLRETWAASKTGEHASTPLFMKLWWGSWILGNLLWHIRRAIEPAGLGLAVVAPVAATTFELVITTSMITAATCATIMVRRVTQLQDERLTS
jgi:hypothetical protein